MLIKEKDIILLINLISANKFKEIGDDILLIINKNHHKANLGIKFIIPLLTNILRLLKRSYEILAKQNKPEEHKPWAIIIK